MLRKHVFALLLTSIAMALPLNLLMAQQQLLVAQQQQQPADAPELGTPAFLQPPPQDLLRKGLQPLSAELPNSVNRDGLLPPDASQGLFGETQPRSGDTYRGPSWTPTTACWAPSGNRYRPLYFEDAMLERHGQTRSSFVQPFASGTRFFASIAALPYTTAVNPPLCPTSSLGHFRAGSRAPCLLQRPPLQADAGMLQAGVVVGLIFIVP